MRIRLELDKEYEASFREQFLARSSLGVTFVMAGEADEQDPCEYLITDRPAEEVSRVSGQVIQLVDQAPEADWQVCRLQRFSYVYAQIMHCIARTQKEDLVKTPTVICVVCPGSEETRNSIALALSGCLADRWDRVAYLCTEGIDLNDRLLDSPQDEGFTRLFLASENRAALTYFSYQHAQHFYFLGSARSRRDKRSLGKEDYAQLLQRFRQEESFEFLVLELSQEPDEAEGWLMAQAELILSVRGWSEYQRVKWEETMRRLARERPSLCEKCLHLLLTRSGPPVPPSAAVPQGVGSISMEMVEDLYRVSSIGIEFDPGQRMGQAMQPVVEYMQERMMI